MLLEATGGLELPLVAALAGRWPRDFARAPERWPRPTSGRGGPGPWSALRYETQALNSRCRDRGDGLPQAQVLGEGGRPENKSSGVGHQAVVVKGDLDTDGVVALVASRHNPAIRDFYQGCWQLASRKRLVASMRKLHSTACSNMAPLGAI